MYKITCTYDESPTPYLELEYADALQAFEEFAKFVDWGFADKYSTVNLSMPTGKMYTRIFYREGRKVITK
jgi:hypothetical protein